MPYHLILTIDVALDLWQLPPSLLTESLSAEIERHFYVACPAEKRPKAFSEDGKPSVAAELPQEATKDGITEVSRPQETNDEDTNGGKDEKAEPQVMELKATETWEKNDQKSAPEKPFKESSALMGALFTTFRWQWYISGLFKLAAGT